MVVALFGVVFWLISRREVQALLDEAESADLSEDLAPQAPHADPSASHG